MAFFEWNQKYSVGVPSIDQEHQKLFSLISQLFDAMKSGKGGEVVGPVLNELAGYTKTHFAHEEALMQTHGYPELDKHKEKHRALTKDVMELAAKSQAGQMSVATQTANLLKEWLSQHILGTDQRYAPFLREHGAR